MDVIALSSPIQKFTASGGLLKTFSANSKCLQLISS
ncbi:hypothetical protein DOY81_009735 [Sarcophaga bullata]|nr:hypothetical protein DOY81_009735 [Sarcophaga bullata]